jgi:hypothetical protein
MALAPETLASLYEFPAQVMTPAGLEPAGGTAGSPWRVSPGETLALRATLRGPARMLVIGEGPDGSAVQVFPRPGRVPALVVAPESGGPATREIEVQASRVPGSHRLRLIVAPLGFPVEDVRRDQVEQVACCLSLVDLSYEVTTEP